MILRRPARLRGFTYRGPWRYSLTFCTAGRRRAFTRPQVVGPLTEQLLRTTHQSGFELIAYCFMPDHLHLLAQGSHDTSHLPDYCRLLRQRLARSYAGGRLWQRGYYERVLREDEPTEACARYIFSNPVRAGLVERLSEHPFSGGTWWAAACGVD